MYLVGRNAANSSNLIAVLRLLGNLPASGLVVPTFWNLLSVPSS